MSNYIPLLYVDLITYPCPNPDAGLSNLCEQDTPGVSYEYTALVVSEVKSAVSLSLVRNQTFVWYFFSPLVSHALASYKWQMHCSGCQWVKTISPLVPGSQWKFSVLVLKCIALVVNQLKPEVPLSLVLNESFVWCFFSPKVSQAR